jgi:hypothetical protein
LICCAQVVADKQALCLTDLLVVKREPVIVVA